MERPARQALKQKIADAEVGLETSLTQESTTADLSRHDKTLRMLDRLIGRFPASEAPSWQLPLLVAAVALSLLGVAEIVKLRGPLVTVDARLSTLVVSAAADGAGMSSDAEIPLKSLEVAGDAQAKAITDPATSISSLRVAAGTTVVLEQRASCFEIQIPIAQRAPKASVELGLDLLILHPAKAPGQLPRPMELRAKPGTTVTICGDFPPNYALSGSVESIDLYRRQPGDPARGFADMRTPSIVSGKLRMPQVNRATDLQDTEMLSLDSVARGWIFVFPAPVMRVVFSGNVNRLISVSPTPEGGSASLEPSLLEWFTKSPLATAVFGLVTGLVGLLWALGRYFGFLAR
ncbi:hypothetical protein [Rhizobacter sp. OV335]|uniref:hypothetical protein n=1 Tax=Rhizobacter sp. OV335 TaxID=1500264 RepID=UPI0009185A7D|nr:hypothetical protein [Rhizobacter sp. OV335]SHM72843.1 hypothetical protein SAMN02787076_02039 [Rhizobacter sp. OV335]